MQKLLHLLSTIFVTKAPLQLSANFKSTAVKVLPMVALVGAAFSLWSAFDTYQTSTRLDAMVQALSQSNVVQPLVNPLVWLAIGTLLVEAILFGLAIEGLRTRHLNGWRLLTLTTVTSLVYAVIQLLAYNDAVSFWLTLLSTTVAAFILFQIQSYYTAPVTSKDTSS